MRTRTILLTGASGKFGKLLTHHFLAMGDVVIGTARSRESLERLINGLPNNCNKFIGILVNLAANDGIEKLCVDLTERKLYPDCLINNARSIENLKVQDNGIVNRENFINEYLIDVNVPYELTMTLVKQTGSQLKKVLNIGSQYGIVAANLSLYENPEQQSPIHYSVAKAALVHLTKELAVRLINQGVQVNCIAFGGVEGRVDESFKQRYSTLCPSGRMLKEDEVVGPVELLLSDLSLGITGQTLISDGGWCLW